jgi:hypothetical protein
MANRLFFWLTSVTAFHGVIARGETPPQRPALSSAVPIAICKLQTVSVSQAPQYEQTAIGLYSVSRPADDPLANYQRTSLGDWRVPAETDRNDPWLRLALLTRKRPVVIDLAVFIDGRSFRDSREAWIDGVIAAAKSQADRANDEDMGDVGGSGNNNSPSLGTSTAEAASEDDASQSPPENERPPSLGETTVAAQSRQAPTMRNRLMSYLTMSGAEADRAEIGWLLSEWGAGPAVVLLATGLSWQRAGMAPLENYLDQDADGALSTAEVGQIDSLLKRADFNSDDVVDVNEIRRATSRPPVANAADGHSLLVLLDAKTDWGSLEATLERVYGDRGGTPTVGPRELSVIPADITLRVDFRKFEDKESASGAAVLSISKELQASNDAVVASSDVLSLGAGGDFVEFCAAQAPSETNQTASASQIAIGAVLDGNPLLRLVDHDQDGRLTLRERQDLRALMTQLDRDADGSVSSHEIPTPIRLAVTPGPHVHELLATPTGSVRTVAPSDAAPKPPDWFVSMDKNQDRDLSRDEFLGTTEQFRQFDADADGLLSAAEALKLNAGQ